MTNPKKAASVALFLACAGCVPSLGIIAVGAPPDPATPKTVDGEWELRFVHDPQNRRAEASRLLFLDLRTDGSARLAQCPDPEQHPPYGSAAGGFSCAGDRLICSTGSWTYANRQLTVRTGSRELRGAVNFLPASMVWFSDVLGPTVASETFHYGSFPRDCD